MSSRWCAGHLQFHPEVIAAAADGDLVLSHEEGLGAGIVLVADFGEDRNRRVLGYFPDRAPHAPT